MPPFKQHLSRQNPIAYLAFLLARYPFPQKKVQASNLLGGCGLEYWQLHAQRHLGGIPHCGSIPHHTFILGNRA
jgi:hypothetical protein